MLFVIVITVGLFVAMGQFVLPWLDRNLPISVNRSWFWVVAVVGALLLGPIFGILFGLAAGLGVSYLRSVI